LWEYFGPLSIPFLMMCQAMNEWPYGILKTYGRKGEKCFSRCSSTFTPFVVPRMLWNLLGEESYGLKVFDVFFEGPKILPVCRLRLVCRYTHVNLKSQARRTISEKLTDLQMMSMNIEFAIKRFSNAQYP
jgi:hypothetical protein